MERKTFQIKIVLRGSEPKIWRRILVPADLLLPDFHKIIQTTMGWTNSHLHQFVKNRTYYLPESEYDDFWSNKEDVDYSKVKISDLLKRKNSKITYEYDFGDNWVHDIILEKITSTDESETLPVCIAGENSCPPEDCGGIWSYERMLEVLKNPENEEYEDYIDWVGEDFDPEYFNIDEVNKLLKTKDFGCPEFF